MTDAVRQRKGQRRGQRAVELRVAPRLENLVAVRTLVGAVAVLENLDVDTVADLRLAIDELCTQLIVSAAPDAPLVIVIDPGDDDVVVEAATVCTTPDVLTPGSFSWYVLTSLVDDVRSFHDGRAPDGSDGVFGVTLTTRRAGADR